MLAVPVPPEAGTVAVHGFGIDAEVDAVNFARIGDGPPAAVELVLLGQQVRPARHSVGVAFVNLICGVLFFLLNDQDSEVLRFASWGWHPLQPAVSGGLGGVQFAVGRLELPQGQCSHGLFSCDGVVGVLLGDSFSLSNDGGGLGEQFRGRVKQTVAGACCQQLLAHIK